MAPQNQYITLNGQTIPLSIHRHKAARRVSLRISPAGDGVVMTLPMRASLPRAMAFLHQKAGWILTHITQGATPARLQAELSIPILGKVYSIEHMPGRGLARLHEGKLLVHGAPEFTARRVKDFLTKHLQAVCLPRAQQMAAQLGKSVRSVRIGTMRSRWGSCTASGALAFNWRLVFAPPEIVEYLIAHEVAHLAHMNHSPRFWQVVAGLYPDYKNARTWLRREGPGLYRYQ